MKEPENGIPKRRIAIWIVATISIILNIVLIFSIRMSTTFLPDKIFWTEFSLNAQGVLVFDDKSKQPDVKEFAQHLTLDCLDDRCLLTEVVIMGEHALPKSQIVKPIDLNYKEQTVRVEWQNCRIQIVNEQAYFTCKDKDSGKIGRAMSAV